MKNKQPSDEALRLIFQLIKKTSYPRTLKKKEQGGNHESKRHKGSNV